MKEINGIKTNLGDNHSLCGYAKQKQLSKNANLEISRSCIESEQQMFNRLCEKGYKKITFYYDTTNVKGLHSLFAFCK